MQINDFPRDEAVRHPLVTALAVLIFAECAAVSAAAIYLVVEILVGASGSILSAVALTVITVVAAVWLGFIAVNVLRGRAWTRGAALTWQVLQVVIGLGCFQGLLATPAVGVALIAAAIAVVVLLFTPPVIAATSAREPRGQD